MWLWRLFFALSILGAAGPAFAHGGADLSESGFDADKALAYSRDAVGREVGDYRLYDRHGRPVKISDFHGRPIIVSLMYTSCAHTCPLVTANLARIVKGARAVMGDDSFTVISVGFDSKNDSPGRMRIFANEQGVSDIKDWRFLSADHATIDALARDLGFIYFRTPKGFDHITQTTLIDSRGRVYQHIYGVEFDAPRLVAPLRRLAIDGGRNAPTTFENVIDRVRLFCTVYDPARDRYRFDYSIIVALLAGIISLSAFGWFLIHAWRGARSGRSRVLR